MKRLNPATGLPFKYGNIREDGFIFKQYCTTRFNKDGTFVELWHHPYIFNELKEKTKLSSQNWYKNNKAHRNAVANEHYLNNKPMYNAKSAKRRAAKLNRMLQWGKEKLKPDIDIWYTRAKLATLFMGEEYQVDHIVPLQGKSVSGLHVPWNLQLLTKSENSSKGNRHVAS